MTEEPAAKDAAPTVTVFSATGAVRTFRDVTDDDVAQVIVQARALIRLDKQLWDARQRAEQLERRLAEREQYAEAARSREADLQARLNAVRSIHWEAEQPSCADGCCHEGLGWCRECGEGTPFPCKTYKAARGETS
jgi:hypothetical protein